MKAMVLNEISKLDTNRNPLKMTHLPDPSERENELLLKVLTCGVCHTELDEIEGRTPPAFFPVVPGHQIVGTVIRMGSKTSRFNINDRVGVGWIHSACGTCSYCARKEDNLCDSFKATGRDVNGGYAEYTTVPEDFAFTIPEAFSDVEAAPLLCAGTIGYRSLRLAGLTDGENLGLTGFGSSAHLVIQMARHKYPRSKVFVFARSRTERDFARELGAFWTGDTTDSPPEKLRSIIDTTPVWRSVVEALASLEKGGRLVINAIRKEDVDKDSLLSLDYPRHLWLEKEIKSVANVAKQDIGEFLDLAVRIPIRPEVQEFRLEDANRALVELKESKIRGAKVLRVG
jgi:propanol-preferring alcohol dehydrogenase